MNGRNAAERITHHQGGQAGAARQIVDAQRVGAQGFEAVLTAAGAGPAHIKRHHIDFQLLCQVVQMPRTVPE